MLAEDPALDDSAANGVAAADDVGARVASGDFGAEQFAWPAEQMLLADDDADALGDAVGAGDGEAAMGAAASNAEADDAEDDDIESGAI